MTTLRKVNIKQVIAMIMAGLLMMAFIAPTMANSGNGKGSIGNNDKAEDQGQPQQQVTQSTGNTVCQPAGDTSMTAIFVNEPVVGETVDLDDSDCDLAIYFDESAPDNAEVRDSTVTHDPGTNVSGAVLWNNGGRINVTNSYFYTDVDGQVIPVRFDDGARGRISNNLIEGNHRVGMLIRGADTDVDVKGNTITGTGAKTSGWAENGIQVDQGASANIVNNTVTGHWWDGESNFGSTGILLFGSDNRLTNNTMIDNEFSVYIVGDGNRVSGNHISSTIVSESTLAFMAYGILVGGSENQITGNGINAVGGAAGVYIFPGTESNRLHGNRISGFAEAIIDGGANTEVRGNPEQTGSGIEVHAHPAQ